MKRDSFPALIGAASIALAILLPLLTVLPFGWLWLWQNGYLPYWLGGTLLISVMIFAGRFWLIRRFRQTLEQRSGSSVAEDVGLDRPLPTPREARALEAVETLAQDIDPKRLSSREDLIALGHRTIEVVAREMHPEEKDPIWNFTVPEALSLVERVAQRLRPMIVDHVPLGDRLSVGQVMRVYQWRSYLDVANKAYDLWRVLRLLNPVAAATQEIRERMSKAAVEGLREDFAKRLTEIYVREVGHAAIDLYSGRLRVSGDVLDDYVSPDTLAERGKSEDRIAEPLRFLIAGQQGAGKTSLINAMADDVQSSVDILPSTRDFQGFEVQREGLPPVVLVDSPGLSKLDDVDALVEGGATSDLIVWVVPAHRADRDIDRQALEALQTAFAEMVDRRPPAVLLVATHIDRLRPFHVWAPPYDVEDGQDAKSQSIHTALLAVRDDLPISESAIVPVSLSPDHPAYNVDLVWAQIAGLLPEVKSAQLLRRLAGAVHSGGWGKVLSQAVGAGRLMVRTMSNRGRRS